MTRRHLFLVAAAASLATVLPTAAPVPNPPLRLVWRKTASGWARVRLYELREGDVFRMKNEPTDMRACSHPYRGTDGRWEIYCQTLPQSEPDSAG